MFKNTNRKVYRGLIAVFAFLFTVFVITSGIAETWRNMLDQAFGTKSSMVVATENAEDEDLYTYKSDYKTTQEMVDADRALGTKVAEEGVVLLKNEKNTLPLTESEDKVSLVGMSAYMPQLGGMMGSSASNNASVNEAYAQVDLKKALAEQEIGINPDLDEAYANIDTFVTPMFGTGKWEHGYRSLANLTGSFGMTEVEATYTVNEVSQEELETARPGITTQSFGEYQTAIVVIGRPSSEGRDFIPGKVTDAGATDPLGLTDNERDMIAMAKENVGEDGKIIVLINSSSMMELKELEEDEEIGAILWIGNPGPWGMRGVVNVLTGVSPSGHLPDTYAVDNSSSAAAQNVGVYVWGNASDISLPAGTYMGVEYNETTGKYDNLRATAYEVQAEGIYVGYKYYETRYADSILHPESGASSAAGASLGANTWKYENEVVYPFGYGLSYTTFEQELLSCEVDLTKKTVTAEVEVTNTGSVAGKDAVQLYVSVPYTDYDKSHNVEKSAIQLLDYAKTSALEPGESEVISIVADMTYMASYDSTANNGEGTYILDDGEYFFAIGDDSHAALNNVLSAQNRTVADGMTADGDSEKVYRWTLDTFDATTFSRSKNGTKIENQLQNADFNYYLPGTVTYLTRSDWAGTFPKEYNGLTVNAEMIEQLRNRTYEIQNDSEVSTKWEQTNDIKLTLAHMKEIPFEDERWDMYINQMSLEEALECIARGSGGVMEILSLTNPRSYGADGPNGINSSGIGQNTDNREENPCKVEENDANRGYKFGTMPCAPLIAATFDQEIGYEIGRHFGNQSLWTGVQILTAPGLNLHRSAYGGRTHEYYSEDSVLAAYTGGMCVKGALELGCILMPKHFAFNDYEYNRYGLAESMREQSAREGDLRCFQEAIEQQGALGLMTAFNRLGVSYINGHTGLMQNILRKEWGFKGIISTDMVNNAYLFQLAESIMGGVSMMANNNDLRVPGAAWAYATADNLKNDSAFNAQIHENMKYSMYAMSRSNLLNGMNESSEIVQLMTWWRAVILGGEIGSAVLGLAALAGYIVTVVKQKKEENAA